MTTSLDQRFSSADVETWRREGIVLLRDAFTPEECAAVRADFEVVFNRPDPEATAIVDPAGPKSRLAQFKNFDGIPFDCSPALNLVGVHPALVAFARAALGVEAVHLYQCQAWAKYTGETDYDQPFHADFPNHTLTAPSDDPTRNAVTIFCYFTDVSDAHGATHYVTRSDSRVIAGPEATLNREPSAWAKLQSALMPHTKSAASPAGTAIAYTTDVFHRGTNLTAPGGYRYAVMACFKKAGDDSVGYTAWAYHHMRPWWRIFDHATPEQLACFGVQPPGDPFWTETTIARTKLRYPGWNDAPYRAALKP